MLHGYPLWENPAKLNLLSDKGLVDKALYEQANLRFYEQYKQGTLDIHEFLNFALTPLAENDFEQLQSFHAEFMDSLIRPVMTQAGQNKIKYHRERGDTIGIITAKCINQLFAQLYHFA